MKVTYVYHSCFTVEINDKVLVFDYFKGELPDISKDKSIYVFSSHKHHDHFDLSIFNKFKDFEKVTYILSNDIKLNEKYLERNNIAAGVKKNIINIKADSELLIDDIKIETLKSTDMGVAFIINTDGKSIYHAGDLNWWHWEGESDTYNKNMERDFKMEIDKIKGKCFDTAFLPADSRQEDYFWWGIDYFMENTSTSEIFPMHFWDDYSVFERLNELSKAKGYSTYINRIEREGQSWESRKK